MIHTVTYLLTQVFVNSSLHITLLEHYERWYRCSSYSWTSTLLTDFYDKTCCITLCNTYAHTFPPFLLEVTLLNQTLFIYAIKLPLRKVEPMKSTTRSLEACPFTSSLDGSVWYPLVICSPLTGGSLNFLFFYTFFRHFHVSLTLCLFLLRN